MFGPHRISHYAAGLECYSRFSILFAWFLQLNFCKMNKPRFMKSSLASSLLWRNREILILSIKKKYSLLKYNERLTHLYLLGSAWSEKGGGQQVGERYCVQVKESKDNCSADCKIYPLKCKNSLFWVINIEINRCDKWRNLSCWY